MFDFTQLQNKLENEGSLRTRTETKFFDGTIQPANPIRRVHGAEAMMGPVILSEGKTFKLLHLPAETMEMDTLITMARIALELPWTMTEDDVLKELFSVVDSEGNTHHRNIPADPQRREYQVMVAILKKSRATFGWCNPKSGTSLLWIPKGGDVAEGENPWREWGDLAPFNVELVNGIITEKMAKRLSFLNWESLLHMHQPHRTVVSIEVTPDLGSNGEIIGYTSVEEIESIDPNAFVILWWKSIGKVDDGWVVIANKTVLQPMVDGINGLLHMADPTGKAEIHARTHALWNVRIIIPKGTGAPGTYIKGNAGVTSTEHIVFKTPGGKVFNADLAGSSENFKGEVSIESGVFGVFEDEIDKIKVGKTNRHLMILGDPWLLDPRINHGIANMFDSALDEVGQGTYPEWFELEIDDLLDPSYMKTTVKEYHRRTRTVTKIAGNVTMSNKVLADIREQTDKSNRPQKRFGRFMEDARKFPIPGSDAYRSLKPLSMAILCGWAKPETFLRDGEWMNTEIGMVANLKTYQYMMEILGGGDGDDHGMLIHGVAGAEDKFKLYEKGLDGANNRIFKMLNVQEGEIITLVWRTPYGVSCDGEQWGAEYFVLRPSPGTLKHLQSRFDFNHPMYRIDLDNRVLRVDELNITKDMLDNAWKTTKINIPVGTDADTPYTEDSFATMVQGALAGKGLMGMISNVMMLCFQHNVMTEFRCLNETIVDAGTQSVLSIKSANEMRAWVEEDLAMVAMLMPEQLDQIHLDARFRSTLGMFIELANSEMLFGKRKAQHIKYRKRYFARMAVLITQQAESMRKILADTQVPEKDILNGVHKLYNQWLIAQRTVHAHQSARVMNLQMFEKYNLMGDMVVGSIDKLYNGDRAAMRRLVLEALAWSYRNPTTVGNRTSIDGWLMNGRLLELTAEALALVNPGPALAAEKQVHVVCTAQTHAWGCWIDRFETEEYAEVHNAAGKLSKVCKDAQDAADNS